MKFAYQAEPGEQQWAGTIHLVDMQDVVRIEFEDGNKKVLHVYTNDGIMTISRADAIQAFRDLFNQYLFQYNVVGNFLPDEDLKNADKQKAD
ncbi:putative structural protein [Escherichia phage vB_EcoM_fHy-Eco03]|nr:putative structural protein [Escherichia phage vB_EcoM_fHy-Eco03]